MNQKPRVHHFVPQFWIKRFSSDDGKVWAYDRTSGEIRNRSPKHLMQIFNLYTVQPSADDDTTLESRELSVVDSEGATIFDRVINGDLSQATKENLASFFSVQVLRDPLVVTSYSPKAQELAFALLEVFESDDYEEFCRRWEVKWPGVSVSPTEFSHLKALELGKAENALELIITALDGEEGLPDLPFTDVVRSPDSRRIVCERLLGMSWTLKKASGSRRFVLGDTGVLYEKGDLRQLFVPLASTSALFLKSSTKPNKGIFSAAAAEHEVMSLNLESAARARRWLVGERKELEALRNQVGAGELPARR